MNPACAPQRVRSARLGLALASALLLAGCAGVPLPGGRSTPPPAPPTPAEPQRLPELAAFRATLSGPQAVPPSTSSARGELIAVLDRNTGLLRWKLRFEPLSGPVQGAGFHSPGMDGELAPQVLGLGQNVLSPSEGRAMISAAQRADLLAGQWYVNLPTARWPHGELRGQLLEQRN